MVTLGLLFLGFFVKHTVMSRFDAIPGNIGDAKFLLCISEHWYQVFTGQADWLSPGFFYPQTGVLGFSDSFFLFGAVYALLRTLGLDAYVVYQVIVVTLPLLGYFGAWLMLRQWLGFSLLSSVTTDTAASSPGSASGPAASSSPAPATIRRP